MKAWLITYDDETVHSDPRAFEEVLNDFIKDEKVIDIKFASNGKGYAALVLYNEY